MAERETNGGEKPSPAQAAREAKLARALRDNLKRRKAAGRPPPSTPGEPGESS